MRRVSVYERKGTIFVGAMSLTEEGVWVGDAQFAALPSDTNAGALGALVASAAVASRTNIPHPVDFRALITPLLQMAGVKGWSAFARHAHYVDVTMSNDETRIVPHRRIDGAGSFEPLDAATIVLRDTPNLDELGKHVRTALSASKT